MGDEIVPRPSKSSWKYLLVVRCDVSSFIDLFPAESPTAHHTAESLLEWFSRYGVVSTWVSISEGSVAPYALFL